MTACCLIILALGFATPAQAENSALERVQRTHILRCGYLPYEPFVVKDINTGRMSGLTVDYVNEVAKRHGLTVEWASEVNIDQIAPALNGGRIDAFCLPSTPDKNWIKTFDFPAYLGAVPYYTYVREDNAMTAAQLAKARFVTVDGYAMTDITRLNYPDASFVGLPQTASNGEMYDQLRYDKADAEVNDAISAARYMANNPGVIRRFSEEPVVATRFFMVTRKGDVLMHEFMDEIFDADRPDNLALMKDIRAKYGVDESSLLLGAQCAHAMQNELGWTVCKQP